MSRNYGLYTRHIKRIFGIIGAILAFVIVSDSLNYMYVSDGEWESVMWHHFYEDNGKIDMLYLGSSHVYCDINTIEMDDINGQYNFNLSSSAQNTRDSFYLLKEADYNNALSGVYLELYYACNVKKIFELEEPIDRVLSSEWVNIDYMQHSVNRFTYMFSDIDAEDYIGMLLPFYRYRQKLDKENYIKGVVETKKAKNSALSDKYYYNNAGEKEMFGKQGYYYFSNVFLDEQRLYYQDIILEKNPLGEKSEKYLRKIISYCQERNIPITLFISPIDELQLISTEHYDNYISQIKEIADEYNVPFYDFNLAKEEYLPIHYGEYFMDIGHLNYAGASMFTPFFSEVVSKDVDENEKYFYSSYDEKLQSEEAAIYGFYYKESEVIEESMGQAEILACRIASNREQGMEYRIVLTINEEEGESRQQMLQDFSENKEFTIPADEHGICTIIARMKDNPEEVQTLKINY